MPPAHDLADAATQEAATRPSAAAPDDLGGEAGFSTAELLANAAFAIVALFAIWQALQALGIDVIARIGAQLSGGL